MSAATTVVIGAGTRPEAIKLAPVYRELRGTDGIQVHTLLTGQHEEQLKQVLDFYSVESITNLHVMRDRQRLPMLAGRIMVGAAAYFQRVKPAYVVVQGDTLSTIALAWTAYLERVPFAHVEAGLRSWEMQEPFPEEANRLMADLLADLCLPPTNGARENLLAEGVDPERIVVTGQTGVDAILHAATVGSLPAGLPPGPYVTVTLHRRENWPVLRELASAIRVVAEAHPEIVFVFPVHLNPIVRNAVLPELENVPGVYLLDPLPHGDMAALLTRSRLIITDSGGLQEEGVTLGIPTLVVRNVTERPEGLMAGGTVLIGVDPERLVDEATRWLAQDPIGRWSPMANPFGDGAASRRVAEAVAWRLGLGDRPVDWAGPRFPTQMDHVADDAPQARQRVRSGV